jgi:hypothetical protein
MTAPYAVDLNKDQVKIGFFLNIVTSDCCVLMSPSVPICFQLRLPVSQKCDIGGDIGSELLDGP